jgi:tetratricopeptide (TPR) repeat protein
MWIFILFISFQASGQNPDRHIRKGNKDFENQDYRQAEVNYLKALAIDSADPRGLYNRAAALYKQGDYQQATQLLDKVLKQNPETPHAAQAWHNLGNSFLQNKKYKEALAAYKQALRNNPSDKDTKYNYSYALEKLKEQQKQQQNKKQQDNKNNKNQDQQKNKDQQQQDNKNQQQQKNKDQQQKNKDQQQKSEQDKQKQQPPSQPQPKEISKKDAERMLRALQNNEKRTVSKVKREKAKSQKTTSEKDW